jgi:hypothetical protein
MVGPALALAAGRGGNVSAEIQATPKPGNFFMAHKDALVQALKSAQLDGYFRRASRPARQCARAGSRTSGAVGECPSYRLRRW